MALDKRRAGTGVLAYNLLLVHSLIATGSN